MSGSVVKRALAFGLTTLVVSSAATLPARAENAMGYRMLSEQEAATLPHNHGALGLDVSRAQQIVDAEVTFDIMAVTSVRAGSPAGKAGLQRGDQIIAVNSRVFPSLKAFAAYVNSMEEGSVASVDYMPAGSGPARAQRVAVTVGDAAQRHSSRSVEGGLSTGTKLAIGAGAVALFGCYELGCFSHHQKQPQRR
jgi:predicted metalloprotease with PDZ domain